MVRDVVTVKPDTQVNEAVKLLAKHDVSALPVVDDARIGRRSERSGFAGTAGDRRQPSFVPARSVYNWRANWRSDS
jgi:CBS-domain-containing membrane protein